MAKRTKQDEPRPKPQPFNNPFGALKTLKKEQPRTAAKAPPPPPAKKKEPKREEDLELFLQAMDGVVPIPKRGPAPPPPEVPPPPPTQLTDDAESMMQLAELVSGEGSFELSSSEEFAQGSAPNMDPRVVRSLRRGEYPLQGRLDLHGKTREEAREAVDAFVSRSRREGKRCVLIVHGRGLNSKDQIPVLKDWVQEWLTHGRMARSVLAFTTARPSDGGAGAVYVLLRKAGR